MLKVYSFTMRHALAAEAVMQGLSTQMDTSIVLAVNTTSRETVSPLKETQRVIHTEESL